MQSPVKQNKCNQWSYCVLHLLAPNQPWKVLPKGRVSCMFGDKNRFWTNSGLSTQVLIVLHLVRVRISGNQGGREIAISTQYFSPSEKVVIQNCTATAIVPKAEQRAQPHGYYPRRQGTILTDVSWNRKARPQTPAVAQAWQILPLSHPAKAVAELEATHALIWLSSCAKVIEVGLGQASKVTYISSIPQVKVMK